MADAGKIVITPKGAYSSTKTYEWLDEVSYNGNAYVALKTVTGVTPSDDGVNWRLFMSSADVDANVLVPKFTEASTRSNIVSGENLSTMFGKIKKWFTDLKSHAFKDLVNNLTTETTGSALDASQGKILKDEVDGVNRKLSGIEKGAEITAATISGSNPTVTNSANAPLIYGKIEGYSEQKTFSGKNLLKITNPTQTTDGITFTVNEDGNITINGTATADTNFDVTLIANITGNGNIKRKLFQLNGSYTGTVEHCAFTSDLGHAFLVPIGEEGFLNTDVTYSIFRIKVSSGTVCNNLKVGFMVAEDVSEYEPFCGGIASPNPDYPQDIKGLGDSGTIEVKTCWNNFAKPYTEMKPTLYGITATRNSDGSVTFNGTATENADFILAEVNLDTDKEYITNPISNGSVSTYFSFLQNTTTWNVDFLTTNGYLTFVPINTNYFYKVRIVKNVTVSNLKVYPMVRLYSVEDDTYHPHQETTATIPIDTLYEGDYLEVYADGSGKIVRENKTLVLDEKQNYEHMAEWTNESAFKWYGGISDAVYVNGFHTKANLKCSHLPINTPGYISTTSGISAIGQGNYGIYLSINGITTEAGLREYLTENPITVIYKLATPTEAPLTAEQVEQFKQLYTFDNVTNFFCDGEITARYYVNTDSGDTVGMLQEQAKENLEQIKNDLLSLNKTITETYTTNTDFSKIVGGTVSSAGLTNIEYTIPTEISSAGLGTQSNNSGTLVDALKTSTSKITEFFGTLYDEISQVEEDNTILDFSNNDVTGSLNVFHHKLSEGTYLLDIKVTITSITETLSGNGPSVDLTLQDIGFEDNIIAIRESECLLASYYPLIVNGSSYCLGGGMVSTENSTKGFYLRFLPHKNTKGSISSNNKSVLSGTMMIKVVEQQL